MSPGYDSQVNPLAVHRERAYFTYPGRCPLGLLRDGLLTGILAQLRASATTATRNCRKPAVVFKKKDSVFRQIIAPHVVMPQIRV